MWLTNVTKNVVDDRFVQVDRPDVFLVLAKFVYEGDYYTGLAPQLSVSIVQKEGTLKSGTAWIKLVGTWLDSSEVGRIRGPGGDADFYRVVPGVYLALLLDGDQLVCTSRIQFLKYPAHLQFTLVQGGCTAQADSNVKVLDDRE